jgi:hypothetical protein
MDKEDEIEEERFEALLQDKRHKELTKQLGELVTAISSKSDKSVVDAIAFQGESIKLLVKAIREIPKQNIPNIELNPKEFVTSANQICKDIIESNNKVIEALENRLLPDTFELIKVYGVTQSVKVKYKKASEINTITPKYLA